MTNPAQAAAAQNRLNANARSFMGMTYQEIANALVAVAGPSFDAVRFVNNVGTIQLNRIKNTDAQGTSINEAIAVALAGTWQNAGFEIVAPSDRFRVILGFKFNLVSRTTDGGEADIGAVNVPAGAIDQLKALGLMQLNRSRGRMVISDSWQWCTGASNRRQLSEDPLVPDVGALPRIPSEQEILPWGLGPALATALDAINPQDRCAIELGGMNGVAVAAAFADDLLVTPSVIVLDAVMSGQ